MYLLKRLLREEDGATMVEYGLMIALIAMVAFLAVVALGLAARGLFTSNGSAIANALGS